MKSVVILLLFALTVSAHEAPQSFEVSLLNHTKQFKNDEAVTYVAMNFEHNSIYLSNYTSVSKDEQKRLIQKKKKKFLELFADDIDPYTQKKVLKSLCLKKSNEDSVEFYSGSKGNWAGCRIVKSARAGGIPTVRKWVSCHNTVWEVTVQSEHYDQAQFNCH